MEIVFDKIEPFQSDVNRTKDGSEFVFNGRVRDREEGNKIVALEYEHYEDMTEKELQKLAEDTVNRFPISDIFCRHRVGRIPVGDISLHVSIWSEHRTEGFEAMSWFISELKKRVPIWKWAILPDGQKIPT
jgi:molybdopterin synthase catalytic subunit